MKREVRGRNNNLKAITESYLKFQDFGVVIYINVS